MQVFIYVVHNACLPVISCIIIIVVRFIIAVFDLFIRLCSSFVQLLFCLIILFGSTFVVHCSLENIQF